MPGIIDDRKLQHIKIAANGLGAYKNLTTRLEEIELFFYYNAMPELSKEEIDIKTQFLGRTLNAPLMVTGMTGGCKEAIKINKDIAKACQKFSIPQGVGSQRAMLEKPELTETYQVRDVAPDILLFGNLGGAQLKNYSIEQIEKMLNDIQANVLAIHLNPVQEAIQSEGITDFTNVLEGIEKISKELSKPVIVKEVGHGISKHVAQQLNKTNIVALDVSGAGGTSWAKIEYLRKANSKSGPFEEFGIPTKISLEECRKVFKKTIIASGGIRTGLDVVKCLLLGADIAGYAYPVIAAQQIAGQKGIEDLFIKTFDEIKTTLFLLGVKNLNELKKLKL